MAHKSTSAEQESHTAEQLIEVKLLMLSGEMLEIAAKAGQAIWELRCLISARLMVPFAYISLTLDAVQLADTALLLESFSERMQLVLTGSLTWKTPELNVAWRLDRTVLRCLANDGYHFAVGPAIPRGFTARLRIVCEDEFWFMLGVAVEGGFQHRLLEDALSLADFFTDANGLPTASCVMFEHPSRSTWCGSQYTDCADSSFERSKFGFSPGGCQIWVQICTSTLRVWGPSKGDLIGEVSLPPIELPLSIIVGFCDTSQSLELECIGPSEFLTV